MQFDHRQIGSFTMTTFRLMAGEKIPAHQHDDDGHITIIAGGKVRLTGDEERDLEPGEIVDVGPGSLHGFEALEDGAIVINAFRV